jgi:hypothetical protein
MFRTLLGTVVALGIIASSVFAQAADGGVGPSALLAIDNEAPATLIVDAPLPGPLARGAVLIPYRVENFRILPVLGADAVKISPRVGHLHVSLDDLPWRWGDFSNTNTIVVNGLPAGPHKIKIELSDPQHRILASQTVSFTVPGSAPAAAAHTH